LVGVNTLVLRYTSSCSNNTLHVSNIAPSFGGTSGKNQVRAVITIQDANHAPVSAATVAVTITLPNGTHVNRTANTNTNGDATISITKRQNGTYTFTVTNVTKTGWTYDPAANVERSDSITVR
jgi:hypothetical protein